MKYFYLLLTFLIITSNAYPQAVSVGGNVMLAMENRNVDNGIGPEIYLDYHMNKLFALRSASGAYVSYFRTDDSYFLGWFEESAVYFPFKWDAEPYASAGIGYYFFNIHRGSSLQSADVSNVSDSFGFTLGGGVKFSALTKLHFNLGAKYIFVETKADIISSGFPEHQNLNFSTLIFSIGISGEL